MFIALREIKARTIELKPLEDGEVIDKDTVSLKVAGSYSDEDSREFMITINVIVKSDQGFQLSITQDAFFTSDSEIDEAFKASNFPRINAPAIAYPFLRSLVSTITINAGYPAIIIPTVNFAALSERTESN